MANPKTNAQRMLEKERIPCRLHTYDSDGGAVDAPAVARRLGVDPARVYKTLVTRGASGAVRVFVVGAPCELDLSAAARAAGEKSVSMIHVAEILPLTGYVRGGCSPIGMKKRYPTIVDASAKALDWILVSAGRIGAQLELSPQDLQRATGCDFASVSREITHT